MKPRSPWYMVGKTGKRGGFSLGRKRRLGIGKGTATLNVLTGRSERDMKYNVRYSRKSQSVRVTMDVPAYFAKPYNPKGNQPDKVREVLEVSHEDVIALNNFATRRLQQLAAAAP